MTFNFLTQEQRGPQEAVVCLDAATGREVWSFVYDARFEDATQVSGPGPRSTPTFLSGKVYSVGQHYIATEESVAEQKLNQRLFSKLLFVAQPSFCPLFCPGVHSKVACPRGCKIGNQLRTRRVDRFPHWLARVAVGVQNAGESHSGPAIQMVRSSAATRLCCIAANLNSI